MSDPAAEKKFQDEIIAHLTAHGWLLGSSDRYDRGRALYPEDVVAYVQETQADAWEKFGKLHPQDTEKALLDLVARQLEKADPNATAKDLRRYGTLGVLRHAIKDRGVTLRLCQFKPDHALNPETLAAYAANRLRVVPELKYSPHAKYPAKGEKTEPGGKDWRIDLVFFVNGIPVATMELTRQPAKDNLPEAFHVYSMRQAIEEGFILDVLRNYTTLFDKLGAEGIYQWSEVEQFHVLFFNKKKGDQALSSICKPAWDRWRNRYQQAVKDLKLATNLLQRAKKTKDAVLIANAESEQRDAKARKDGLDLFKKDLGTFTRFYAFMSQIVDYDDRNLEKLNLYARHLAPLLREENPDDDSPDLSSVQLTHYRLQKQREQDLMLNDAKEESTLTPGTEFGSGRVRDKKLEALSQIIARMNDLFAAEDLSEADLVSYASTIAAKIQENSGVMAQVRNNTAEQAMLGDFPKAVEEAVLASGDAHHELMAQFLSSKTVQTGFARLLLEMLSKSA
jgi:type I site-specific restriction-modification system R (restriction) subunit